MAHGRTHLVPAWLNLRALIAAAVTCTCLTPTLAQPTQESAPAQVLPADKVPPAQSDKPKKEPSAIEAFEAGDYALAEELLKKQVQARPLDFVPRYNLACCRAMVGDADGTIAYLKEAIERGFTDVYQLKRDATLVKVRGDPRFKAIIQAWDELLIEQRDRNLDRAKAIFDDRKYTDAFDDNLRLAYRSAFNEKAFAQARQEITKIAVFAREEIFEGILDPEKMKHDAWVVVILPTRPDFLRWAVSLYGQEVITGGNSTIGGAYEHDAKRLVSMDLGATLRHEFFHVLHWRDNVRRGQNHPIWIQEGLCSLIEDYDTDASGKIVPAPSWRTNIAQRLEKLRRLMPIEELAVMKPTRFSGSRPLANYATARSVFLYLYQQGKLKEWYTHYVTNHKADPTGIASLEAVFSKPIKDINTHYRAWLRDLPAVPEYIKEGAASLGLEVESGNGEGPVVSLVDRAARNMPERATAIVKGDVITSIDGKPVRDIAELVRVLSGYKVGDVVEVEYRRVRRFGSTKVTLVEKR